MRIKVRASLIELWKKLTPFKTQEKVYWNGEDNNYSEEMERVLMNSPTGSRAMAVMSAYIFGRGLSESQDVLLKDGSLLSEVVKQVVDDVVSQNGSFIHVSYGIEIDGDKVTFKPVLPKSLNYHDCRISKTDDDNHSGRILVGDFSKDGGRKKKKWYYPFNTSQSVIKDQIRTDAKENGYEGDDWTEMIQFYSGQIMYLNLTPKFRYAVSKFDSVFLDMDSEYRICVYVNQFARGGFLGKTAIITKGLDDETSEIIKETIEGWLGVEGSGGAAHFDFEQAESLDEILKVLQIPSQFDHDQFELVLQNIKRHILGSANNLPEGLAFSDSGALYAGSGESYKQMKQFYWEQNEWVRQKIQDAFWKMGFEFNFLPITEDKNDTINEE